MLYSIFANNRLAKPLSIGGISLFLRFSIPLGYSHSSVRQTDLAAIMHRTINRYNAMKKALFAYAFLGLTSCIAISSCGNRQYETGSNVTGSKNSFPVPDDVVEVVEVAESTAKSTDESYQVSSGYSTDPHYRPTVSDNGKYHTIDGKRRQIQYQGSQEQQRDLDMIDEYMRTHPEY